MQANKPECQGCAVNQGYVPVETLSAEIKEPQKFTGDSEMRRAFEIECGQSWADPDWRKETGIWASAWHKATAAAQLAAVQQGVQRIQANCYSDNDGDSWRDCPDDCDFVEGLKVGDTFELQASIRAWSETYRVTKAPDDTSDDYEVELVSSDAPIAPHPTQQGLDALKPMGWAAEINGAHFRLFDDWLPDDDCYDHGTLVKLFALPVSEEEAQAERDALAAAQAKQGEQA